MLGSLLNYLFVLGLFAALVVAPAWGLVWEVLHRRTVPPFRIERAKHPAWYWTCIVSHAAFLALAVLVFLLMFFAVIILPGLES
jgi:hypothetical protein